MAIAMGAIEAEGTCHLHEVINYQLSFFMDTMLQPLILLMDKMFVIILSGTL
jgi:hypothetical protein